MQCNFELKDKLPEFIKGVLPQAETQGIERHLTDCAECAQEVEQIRLFLPELKRYSDEHILAEVLVDYTQLEAEDFRKVKDSDWNEERLKEHLEICEQCAFELKTLQALEKDFSPAPGKSFQESESSTRFFIDIKKFLSPPRLRFALAAAAILLAAIPVVNYLLQSNTQRLSLPLVAWVEIDKYPSSFFEGEMVTRGVDTETTSIFRDPLEAALDQFIKGVRIVEGKITTTADDTALAKPSRTVLLQLRTQDGKMAQEFAASIPLTIAESSQSTELQAWLMAFPSVVLYRVDMSSDSVITSWDLNLSSRMCVLFTYRSGEGYKSSSPLCTEIIK